MKRTYAYFPGCSAKSTCRELDTSTQAVASLFGVDLRELDNPGCTGGREFRAISEQLHLTANGRILALAEQQAEDLVVVCDTCLLNLLEANERLRADATARDGVNRILAEEGLRFTGEVVVRHLLWVFMEDIGAQRIREHVVRPLRDLKVAPFYGCHLLRSDDIRDAHSEAGEPALDRLCKILGAEIVDYTGADKCCGFHVVASEPAIAMQIGGPHLKEASAEGADCVVTPCPLCHTMLDGYQPGIERETGHRFALPVFHVSQLIGLAAGLPPESLALSRHMVQANEIVARYDSDGRPG